MKEEFILIQNKPVNIPANPNNLKVGDELAGGFVVSRILQGEHGGKMIDTSVYVTRK